MLQSTKLKPVILGVGPRGIMRVDPKTKEVLDTWDYQVLRNWAYSRKTFVLVREVELLAIQHGCLSHSFSLIPYIPSSTCTCKSHPRQLIFLRKSDCLGCAVALPCLFV